MRDPKGDLTPSQAIVAEAMTVVFAPVAAGVGVILLVIATVSRDMGLVPLGLTGLAAGAIGVVDRRRRSPSPLLMLVVASVGLAVSVPFVEQREGIALLPAVTLVALIGVFSLRRVAARPFILWCGLVAIWTIGWHVPDPTMREVGVGLLLLVATGIAGWRLVTLTNEALSREKANSRVLFESSPVAILVEDFTQVKVWLDALALNAGDDLRAYLAQHPEEVKHGISLIEIRQANSAAATLIEAKDTGELVGSFGEVSRGETELDGFIKQFIAIREGRRTLALDLEGMTFEGRPFQAVLHWSVPVIDGTTDLSSVIVTISDITPRKRIEQRLARALEANERLLAFERALAGCSRALLLGSGEDALEVALETLREAIGADRAFLAINVEDPEAGHAFRVVNSASKPEHARDDWVGLVVPWDRYPMASGPLTRGEAFQHLAAAHTEDGWTRSLLAVPILTSGQWSGTVGFVDIARRTEWGKEAVRMLQVAAPMLGTFWERETTRRRLEDLVDSKDRFVASISHELRTPLTAVLGFAEELRSQAADFQPNEATEILELIAEQSRDMADMVEDLLVAARAEIGMISIHPQEVYLRAQVEVALVAAGSTAATVVEVVGGPGKAWADPNRTRQIIRNLITNAVRYGGDEVVIEASSESQLTVLSVRDNGAGLPEAEWERIFEPYQRAHERPTQPASVGLGLTVSRQLARAMGGDLTYRSTDQGSIFELTLPSSPPQEPEDSERGSARGGEINAVLAVDRVEA